MSEGVWTTVRSALGLGDSRETPGLRLVAGLGNPGNRYARTRHNVGFWCLDRLADESGINISRRNRLAVVGEGAVGGVPVALAKPRTYVNESGRAVTSLLTLYRALPADLLIIYDDMALPAGKIRVRPQGGAAGHNGIKSIIDAVGTQEFARLRIGIGRPASGDDVAYVLGAMSADERDTVDAAVGLAVEAVTCALVEGIEVAMNRFN